MLEKKRDSSVLIALMDELPEFCQDYFIGRKNERALSTRIGYALKLRATRGRAGAWQSGC